MALKLVYRGDTTLPVEVEGFTPDWACDKTLSDIERFTIFHGNRKVPLAEMFAVTGDAGDKCFEFEGNLAGVHWIGAHMASGLLRVQGPVGRHLGSGMAGGEIVVEGDAQDWVGAEMHKGLIHVRGHAGHLVGGAYRGAARGMTGGTILIDGNAGHEIGHTMRRGTIAIGGTAGDMIGFNLIAGSVLVFGRSGIRAGAGMRRGTIGLLGPGAAPLLPSFRYGATLRPPMLPLMLRYLREHHFAIDASLATTEIDLYHGDLIELGRGEILMRTAG